jgi:hypothetical protein
MTTGCAQTLDDEPLQICNSVLVVGIDYPTVQDSPCIGDEISSDTMCRRLVRACPDSLGNPRSCLVSFWMGGRAELPRRRTETRRAD